MADITKCANKNCKIKDKCYRFLAKADPLYQSYADFNNSKVISTPKECEYYWKKVKGGVK